MRLIRGGAICTNPELEGRFTKPAACRTISGMALDPVSAIAGWLAEWLGNALVGGVKNVLFGDAQQRAFRRVVASAIDRVIDRLGGDHPDFLADVLAEHRESLESIQHHPDLPTAVSALIASLDDPDDPNRVVPAGFADALVDEINAGILDNGRAGGPLTPLLVQARFAELVGLSGRLQSGLDLILLRQDEIVRVVKAPATVSLFTGSWRSLQEAFLDPTEQREQVQSEPFTGREWLLQEIDDFIATTDRGYFIVQGDAGTGKTAFALWCSGLRQWPIHFSQHSPAARRVGPAVRNLAAQLITAKELHDLAPHGQLPGEADWPSLLYRALAAAAPIVVMVDGLDEAEDQLPNSLAFGLPDDLPCGVHVIVTVRTGGLPHQPRQPMTVCDLNQRVTQQRTDMLAYLAETVQLHLLDQIAEDGMNSEDFISALIGRCGDVWLYLHYVIQELVKNKRRPRDVPTLPAGLEGYYHNTIERFCHDNLDAGWRLPLLATLAVVREPLEPEALANLSGLDNERQVRRFLSGDLRPFCVVTPDGRWSLKHSSFNAYIGQASGVHAAVTANVLDRRLELARHANAAHGRISDFYLTLWGGLDRLLHRLAADPKLAQVDGGYPLRALASHMAAGNRSTDLHRFLASGSEDHNTWYNAHDTAGDAAGFLADVATARRDLDGSSGVSEAERVTWQVRYALTDAAIATHVTNISPVLLAVLVERGRWTIQQALQAIPQMTDGDQQAEALLRLVEKIPDELVRDAWTLAWSLRTRNRITEAAVELIDRLPDDLLDDAVRAVAAHAKERLALRAAARLTRRLPEDRLWNFPFSQMPDMYYKNKMLVMSLQGSAAATAGSDIVSRLARESSEFQRGQDLAEVIPYLPADAFNDVFTMLAQIPAKYRSDPLIALATWAPNERISEVLTLAADGEAVWQRTPPEAQQEPWLLIARAIGRRLTTDQQKSDAISFCLALHTDNGAAALEALALYLDVDAARKGLGRIEQKFESRYYRDDSPAWMVMIGALAALLPVDEARSIVAKYIDVTLRLAEEPELHAAQRISAVAAFVHPDTARMALRFICRLIPLERSWATRLKPDLARFARLMTDDRALLDDAIERTLRPDAWQPPTRLIVLEVLAPHLDDESLDRTLRVLLPGPLEEQCFAAIAALAGTLPANDGTFIAQQAIGQAITISNDRQRVRVLAALAPCLPEPLAVQALEMVAAMTRRVTFPSILDAMDALAPRLPANALARALDALMDTPMFDAEEVKYVTQLMQRLGHDDPTHALSNRFEEPGGGHSSPDRSWIWAIAPFLNRTLAQEALPVARQQRDYARRLSLAALAPRLPHELRDEVAKEALELLDVPPQDPAIKIAVLGRLAAAVMSSELTAACSDAADEVGWTSPDSMQGWQELAWNDLMTHLPNEIIPTALEASTRLHYLASRCKILRPLAPRIPDDQIAAIVAELESAEQGSGYDEQQREYTLVALSSRVLADRDRILTGVLDRMERHQSWYRHGQALLEMIPTASRAIRPRAISIAIAQCFNGSDGGSPGTLTSLLEADELPGALHHAQTIKDKRNRVEATASVLRRAGELPTHHSALPSLHVLTTWPAAITRVELFTLVGASAWWIRRAGGTAGVAATAKAVFEVARWWR